jgi:hypothetical protein
MWKIRPYVRWNIISQIMESSQGGRVRNGQGRRWAAANLANEPGCEPSDIHLTIITIQKGLSY